MILTQDALPPADDLDHVWQALASPWRRRILDLLRDGPLSTGELTEALGSSRHLLLQHLQVLRDVGLVVVQAEGRRRINYLNPVPIRKIYERWVAGYQLAEYQEAWAEALVGLKRTVEGLEGSREEGAGVA